MLMMGLKGINEMVIKNECLFIPYTSNKL